MNLADLIKQGMAAGLIVTEHNSSDWGPPSAFFQWALFIDGRMHGESTDQRKLAYHMYKEAKKTYSGHQVQLRRMGQNATYSWAEARVMEP